MGYDSGMSNGDETIDVQGTRVPALGFGTWLIPGADARRAVRDALEIGYRHIDTARAYENERGVGRGIADSGVPRDEIFLTTKVPHTDAAPELVERDAEESLERLGVDRIDLLLLHWPNPEVPLEQTLGAMDKLKDDGRVRQIGVSNFPAGLLHQALELAPIFTNQVEYHPFLARSGGSTSPARTTCSPPPTPRSPTAKCRVTRRCSGSARRTARRPARSRCGGCSTSRSWARSRRRRATSGVRRTSTCPTSS